MCLKRMCTLLLLDRNILHMSVRSVCFIGLFKSTSLLIFCLDNLPTVDSGILKSPAVTRLMSNFLFSSVMLCFYI